MRFLKLIIVVCFCTFQIFGMQSSETFLSKPYVLFQETIKELIKPYISQIESNEVGHNLIEKICELYERVEEKCNGIIFRHGIQTSFCSCKNEFQQIKLMIDIEKPEEHKYPLIQSSEIQSSESSHYLCISGLSSPFTITLAHELIYLKHKLEEIAGLEYSGIEGIPYSVAKTIGIEDIFGIRYHLLAFLPELQEVRLNMSELWPNLEERRTVIGPDIDNISEHTFRKSMGIPSRFIYQRKDIISLEKQETVSKIISDPVLLKNSVGFSVSILTPLDILLKLSSKEEIFAVLDNYPINMITKNIFNTILNTPENYAFISDETRNFIRELLSYKPKPVTFTFEW